MYILYLHFLLIIIILPLEYSLLRCKLKYFRFARFYLFLLGVVIAASLAKVPEVLHNLVSFWLNMSSWAADFLSNFSILVIFLFILFNIDYLSDWFIAIVRDLWLFSLLSSIKTNVLGPLKDFIACFWYISNWHNRSIAL